MKKIQLLRNYVFIVAAIAMFAALTGCQVQEQEKLTAVSFTDVTIADDFWAPRLETNRKVTI